MRLSEVTDLKWPNGTEWQCANSTLAMSWPNYAQILSFASMASRQGAVKHGFVSKIAGGYSSYDVIAPWPDLTWSIFFYQNQRKVCPIRNPKTRRRYAPSFFRYLRKTSGEVAPTPLSGRGLTFWKPGSIKKGMFSLLLNHCRCRSLLIRKVARLQCCYRQESCQTFPAMNLTSSEAKVVNIRHF